MSPNQSDNLQTVRTRILSAERLLLDHMCEQPGAYCTSPEGLRAYNQIREASALLETMTEADDEEGVRVNG